MISSRMPEGEPNCCPVCRNTVRIEPSKPFGDATCPVCGSLLWFLSAGGDSRIYEHAEGEDIERRLLALLAERLGIDPDAVHDGRWENLDIDSLDYVELIMELEEEL